MVIKFFGPFEKMAEKEARIDLAEPIPLRDLLSVIRSRYPGFASSIDRETDFGLSAHMMFIRGGRPLRLQDVVEDKDMIEVLLPVTGG